MEQKSSNIAVTGIVFLWLFYYFYYKSIAADKLAGLIRNLFKYNC